MVRKNEKRKKTDLPQKRYNRCDEEFPGTVECITDIPISGWHHSPGYHLQESALSGVT
jgi:hypothetical protein